MSHKKEFIENGFRYFVRSNPSGYGFEIIKTIADKNKYGKFSSIFKSLNKELVLDIFDSLEISKNKDEYKFPDTSSEKDMMKVLKIESKHYTEYYSVPTYQCFLKALRKYLIEEYGADIDTIKPKSSPVNNSGVESEDDILSIPIVAVRNDVKIKWDYYNFELKKFNKSLLEWENLKEVVTTDDKGDILGAMECYGSDIWEMIKLTKIE